MIMLREVGGCNLAASIPQDVKRSFFVQGKEGVGIGSSKVGRVLVCLIVKVFIVLTWPMLKFGFDTRPTIPFECNGTREADTKKEKRPHPQRAHKLCLLLC